jgi:DNA-binding response OmpR family regulator
MVASVRVLVVDGSRLMAWLVGAVAPEAIEVQHASSLAEARDALLHHPPQAAMFNLTPARLPWHELAEICRKSKPPIPFRCYSAFSAEDEEAGDLPVTCHFVLDKPRTLDELRAQVENLVQQAHEAVEHPEAGIMPCGDACPGLGP